MDLILNAPEGTSNPVEGAMNALPGAGNPVELVQKHRTGP